MPWRGLSRPPAEPVVKPYGCDLQYSLSFSLRAPAKNQLHVFASVGAKRTSTGCPTPHYAPDFWLALSKKILRIICRLFGDSS